MENLKTSNLSDAEKLKMLFDALSTNDVKMNAKVLAEKTGYKSHMVFYHVLSGRNTLFQFIRDNKVLRDNNTPFQQFIDCGYFRVIESKYNKPDGSVNISLKTVVYQKGIDFIIKRFVGRKLNVA